MYRFQPGQRAQKAEDQGQEHAGRCLAAASFFVARGDNNCYLEDRNIFKHIRSRYFGVPDGH